jgi:hypothetical protein
LDPLELKQQDRETEHLKRELVECLKEGETAL